MSVENVALERFEGESGADLPPCSWMYWRGRVFITCANRHLAGIGDHTIASDGTITPSILCLTPRGPEAKPCGWHVFAKLAGYP